MDMHYKSKVISEFFRAGQAQKFKKGDVILGWGKEPEYIYRIEYGFVKVYSNTNEGEELIQIIYSSSEMFPLIWAFCKVQKDLYYEALSETLVMKIPVEKFLDFARSNSTASFALARQLSHQFLIYSDRLDNLEYKKPSQKIAYRILFMASRFGIRNDNQIVIDGPFTHQIIADSVNLARETVSREIELLEKKGVLGRKGHRIVIKDLESLKKMCSTNVNFKRWGLE